ncbi:hypothetical protein GYA54_00605 [Candidatus Kuenenbacteria bacterium]|nr:hypothetical protein [Candidatus Kuenenbacteria bacterium]
MLNSSLQDGIVVKTKDGVFKLLKNGQLQDLTDDIVAKEKKEVLVKKDPVVPNTTPAERRATANFYFAVDDEKEIRDLKSRESEEKNRRIREFIDKTVEGIIRVAIDAGVITVAGQDEPVRKIIFSRLKDIRTLAEAKEALASPLIMRSKPLGKREIDILLTLVEKQRVKVEEVIRTGVTGTLSEVKEESKPEPAKIKEEPVRPEPKREEPPRDFGVKYGEGGGEEQYYRHIITGPVEEIQNLTLKDFRKLGANPMEAAGRIWQKINLLEDESLIKKDEGIRAWRQSEICRLYLTIGAISMAEKKPVEQVINERKASGQSFLLPEEFNAIADLNSRLIY